MPGWRSSRSIARRSAIDAAHEDRQVGGGEARIRAGQVVERQRDGAEPGLRDRLGQEEAPALPAPRLEDDPGERGEARRPREVAVDARPAADRKRHGLDRDGPVPSRWSRHGGRAGRCGRSAKRSRSRGLGAAWARTATSAAPSASVAARRLTAGVSPRGARPARPRARRAPRSPRRRVPPPRPSATARGRRPDPTRPCSIATRSISCWNQSGSWRETCVPSAAVARRSDGISCQ